MGRSYTPKYVIRLETVRSRLGEVYLTNMEWRAKDAGSPTVANIGKWVEKFEESMKPGGVNAHLGYDPVLRAEVVYNRSRGLLVAEWVRSRDAKPAPMFEVV